MLNIQLWTFVAKVGNGQVMDIHGQLDVFWPLPVHHCAPASGQCPRRFVPAIEPDPISWGHLGATLKAWHVFRPKFSAFEISNRFAVHILYFSVSLVQCIPNLSQFSRFFHRARKCKSANFYHLQFTRIQISLPKALGGKVAQQGSIIPAIDEDSILTVAPWICKHQTLPDLTVDRSVKEMTTYLRQHRFGTFACCQNPKTPHSLSQHIIPVLTTLSLAFSKLSQGRSSPDHLQEDHPVKHHPSARGETSTGDSPCDAGAGWSWQNTPRL